jgi:3-oxoacyl-[acyl-carrier protein] reductase
MSDEATLITGASSDIGCVLIQHLLSRPDAPLVLAHYHSSEEKLRALQSEFGDRLQLLKADFSQSSSVEAMADQIAAQYGTPSAIVHLPALRLTHERFTKFKWDRFATDLSVQVQSAVILLQRFLPKMAKLPRARVVFVLSSVVHGVPPSSCPCTPQSNMRSLVSCAPWQLSMPPLRSRSMRSHQAWWRRSF